MTWTTQPVGAETTLPAGSQSALAVSPAILEEIPVPGTATPFSFQVQNITQIPLPIKTFVNGLPVEDNTLSRADRTRLDASQWFTIKDPDFILQPNQLRTVTGIIQPPANSVPGGHYATIYLQPLVPQEALSPATTYINARVGVLVFLIIKGDVQQKAEVSESLHTTALAQGGPIDFTFGINNTGNVHIMPSGDITVQDVFGREVAKLPLPSGIVLPETARQYTVQWESPGIGIYTARLSLKYGAENTVLNTTEVHFWIFPWLLVVVCLSVLGALWVFVRKIRPRWKRAIREFRGMKWRL